MSKVDKLNTILESGVIAIMRAKSSDQLIAAADAIRAGGVRVIEVTRTTPGAQAVIAEARRRYGEEMLFGAGTVLDAETARSAILAGADFLVAPTLNLEMVGLCHRYGVPVIPGCYTPTEMLTAWEAGADLLKLFPASVGGPELIKAILAPLPSTGHRSGRRRGPVHCGRFHPQRSGRPGRRQQFDQPEAIGQRRSWRTDPQGGGLYRGSGEGER